MDVKKRFKLYKSGKRWVALALLFGGTAFFIETNQTVANADESVAQTSVQSEPDNSLQVQTEDKQESADQKIRLKRNSRFKAILSSPRQLRKLRKKRQRLKKLKRLLRNRRPKQLRNRPSPRRRSKRYLKKTILW